MLDEVSFLMVEGVLELLRRGREADNHDALVRAAVGVGQPRVEAAAREACVSPAQFRAVASDAYEVAYYVVSPISGDGVVDADAPTVSWKYDVLDYHNTSSHSVGVPPPMQSAIYRVRAMPS